MKTFKQPELAIGQVYIENDDRATQITVIELLMVSNINMVRYTSSKGWKGGSYKMTRNRFEGLIRGRVFVLVESPTKNQSEVRLVEMQAQIDVLKAENQDLKAALSSLRVKIARVQQAVI